MRAFLKVPALVSALLLVTVLAGGCASSSKNGAHPRGCAATPVKAKELEQFGFTIPKNKIAVMRIFATWCPYCKEDLAEIGKRFKSGEWTADNVQILLMTYSNRSEGKDTYDKFLRDTFPKTGIPATAAQVIYVTKDFKELAAVNGGDGKPLFEGWKGVPFALVFGKDGRLAFRGHFTNSPPITDAHYRLISEISKEECKPQ